MEEKPKFTDMYGNEQPLYQGIGYFSMQWMFLSALITLPLILTKTVSETFATFFPLAVGILHAITLYFRRRRKYRH